jgi:hypothetical protein
VQAEIVLTGENRATQARDDMNLEAGCKIYFQYFVLCCNRIVLYMM